MAKRPSTWLGALRVIEAAYREPADDQAWLGGITEAATALADRPAAYSVDFDPASPRVLALAGDPELAQQLGRAAFAALGVVPIEVLRAYHSIDPAVDTSTEREARLARRRGLPDDWLRAACAGDYPIDMLGMVAADPSGSAALLLAFHEVGGVPRRLTSPLTLLSAHLSSALRLRRALAPEVEAVLAPDGKVLDATGDARSTIARSSLAEAVLRIDRARCEETSPEEAVELWNAMVEGRWTLVENVERDGKRLMLARRNEPTIAPMTALTIAEAQVATYAAHGHPYKLIAYELGIPLSTVAAHLRAALEKLGFPSRAALIAARVGGDDPLATSDTGD